MISRKAQMPIIEEITLFLIGFLIMAGYLYMNNSFEKASLTYFSELQSELYLENIMYCLIFLNDSDLEGYVRLQLPNTIFDKNYYIYKRGEKLGLYIPDTRYSYYINIEGYPVIMSKPYSSTYNYMALYNNPITNTISIRGE